MKNVLLTLALGVACMGGMVSLGAIRTFVDHPGTNSSEFRGYCTSQGWAIDASLDFATMPLGEVDHRFFQASAGVTMASSGAISVQNGNGSISPNVPDSVGEGLLPEPATYMHTGFGALTTLDFIFDRPVAAFGLMTADMYRWGSTPAATIEAFDSSDTLLVRMESVNESFEFDYLYFMGVADDDARISRVRFSNFGVSGDSIYLTQGWFARAAGCPCPADLDDGSGAGVCDGGVTIDDLLYYLTLFADGDVRGDLDDGSGTGTPDGGVTIDDLLYYLARYEAGC